jgi:hypothetical protein
VRPLNLEYYNTILIRDIDTTVAVAVLETIITVLVSEIIAPPQLL